jgi:hypothetical protein
LGDFEWRDLHVKVHEYQQIDSELIRVEEMNGHTEEYASNFSLSYEYSKEGER